MPISVTADGMTIDTKVFRFPGGEVQVRLLPASEFDDWSAVRLWCIRSDLRNSDDVMTLLLMKNAIAHVSKAPVDLLLPYLAYSRQDRVVSPGEASALQVMCSLITAANFNSVTTWDVHSTAAHFFLTGLHNVPASDFVSDAIKQDEIVVAPDKGAVIRAEQVARSRNRLITATKVRAPDTGALSAPTMDECIPQESNLIIVDDICDGGFTFLQLGHLLRQKTTGRLRLYVTHGIFSKGVDELLSVFDEILTANLFNPAYADRVTVLQRQ